MSASRRLTGALCGCAIAWGLAAGAGPALRPDILIADFEGKDYGPWKTTGEAFGPGPAQGTLPNQMPVTGYLGHGLVNSYHGGDRATGTLTSPPFKIQRNYFNFLIGGGKHPGQTCMNLLRDGKVVRTATGPNDQPGGSERLDWHTWDVRDLAGKTVVLQIVDNHTGGWGHINIDHIVQSDRKLQAGPAAREIVLAARFLNLPIKSGAPRRRMRFEIDGRTAREFEIELAEGQPDFWAFSDVSAFKGRRLRVVVDALPPGSRALEAISQDNEIRGGADLYREKRRPQFHFTSRRGWLNDPNGLVYAQAEYHLFYQHNPYGWSWGNMHWGHAVSKDLVHWRELPIALYPERFGDWCFSGSAVVDRENSAGFRTGKEPALVAAYTSTGRGECLAYSNDRGRTWTDYAGNPVVKHQGRDPKLLWHEPTRQWVMAVYDEYQGKRTIAFHTSADLKAWKFQSRIDGFFECPDLFPLPVNGDRSRTRWVLYAGDGKYVLGNFDGKSFRAEPGRHQLWHGNFYASQTFNNVPDGRRIQIGWASGIAFPGMPFNQQMTVPCVLTLRTTPSGVRLFALPVRELEALHGKRQVWSDRLLRADERLQAGSGELFDVNVEFVPDSATAVGLTVRGVPVVYQVEQHRLICQGQSTALPPLQGRVRLRLLIDRGSIEVFGNDGQTALSVGIAPAETNRSVEVFSQGGSSGVPRLEVFELKSAWPVP
jgi:fructan beta-fructosidase